MSHGQDMNFGGIVIDAHHPLPLVPMLPDATTGTNNSENFEKLTGHATYSPGVLVLPKGRYFLDSVPQTTSTGTVQRTTLATGASSAIRFCPGAMLVPSAGVTVRINGPIEAGPYKIFDLLLRDRRVEFGPLSRVREVHPEWWGARGDGSTDDTAALQAAIDAASGCGAMVVLAPTTYRVTRPLVVRYYNANPVSPATYTTYPPNGLPRLAGIRGSGGTMLRANRPDGSTVPAFGDRRGVLELIGNTNINTVSTLLQGFTISMAGRPSASSPASDSQTHPGAYCLRVGDARGFRAEGISCNGSNGVLIRISSGGGVGAAGYAQINTLFTQCDIRSNYDQFNETAGWYAPNAARVLAVGVESGTSSGDPAEAPAGENGGAAWDNVRFESCNFGGLVQTRATIVEFDNCQFANDVRRPQSGNELDVEYANSVEVRYGQASFKNCYFEGHYKAIRALPYWGPVWKLSVEDCQFTGSTNLADANLRCHSGVSLEPVAAKRIVAVDILRCRFGVRDPSVSPAKILYSAGPIVNSDAVDSLNIVHAVNYLESQRPVPVVGPVHNRLLTTETVYFHGTRAANQIGVLALEGGNTLTAYLVSRPCWIRRVTVSLDQAVAGSSVTLRILKGVAGGPVGAVGEFVYPRDFGSARITDGAAETGYLFNPPTYNDFSKTYRFNRNDVLLVHADAGSTAVGPIRLGVELAFGGAPPKHDADNF